MLPSTVPTRVRAIIPCYNRPADLASLLGDLLTLQGDQGLDVLVIDNASSPPIDPALFPTGLAIRLIRTPENRGGSGGFNAGLSRLLEDAPADPGECFWLLDSDARLMPDTLRELTQALNDRPDAAVAGSALADPATGLPFELGGRLDRLTGELRQYDPSGHSHPIEVEYVAACSLLVRRTVVEQVGLMSDLFINGDDVEWCLRIRRLTGRTILAVPRSIALHPHHNKMRTWDRYYVARNAFAVLSRARAGPVTRFNRAMRETARALAMTLIGRDDLARLHLAGLLGAARGSRHGRWPKAHTSLTPPLPFDALPQTLQDHQASRMVLFGNLGLSTASRAALEVALQSLNRVEARESDPFSIAILIKRLITPRPAIAIASARGRPDAWFAARRLITVTDHGYHVARLTRRRIAIRAAGILSVGLARASRLAILGPARADLVPPRPPFPPLRSTRALSIIILSYNRADALLRTVHAMRDAHDDAEIIVVDNASSDESALRLLADVPDARLIQLPRNRGILGFNIGAEHAHSELLLILDDDASIQRDHLRRAIDLLDQRSDLAAVAFHPRHPATNASEWPFAESRSPTDRWPFMGCGNLIRRSTWLAVGGYEHRFFLYRNDTDLALKLLDKGLGVHFNPDWVVWHDSPAASRKSNRWFRLATRNWVHLCRRHGRGLTRVQTILAGWAWAHKTAGPHPSSHLHTLRGAFEGLFTPAPEWPDSDGQALRELFRIRCSFQRDANIRSSDRHS